MNTRHYNKRDCNGSAVIVVLILLFLMVAFVAMNTATVNRMQREVRLVEKKQLQRLAKPAAGTVTNQPPSK